MAGQVCQDFQSTNLIVKECGSGRGDSVGVLLQNTLSPPTPHLTSKFLSFPSRLPLDHTEFARGHLAAKVPGVLGTLRVGL